MLTGARALRQFAARVTVGEMDPRCPTCKALVARDAATFPFCCERCRLADLGGWLDERYRITGSDEEDGGGGKEPESSN